MAVFDTSNVGQIGQTAVSPTSGVADKSSLIGQKTVGNLIGLGVDIAQDVTARRAQAAVNAGKNSFAQQQLVISDAVERGELSSQEGRRKMRQNVTQALAAGMSFDDLKEVQSGIMSTAGFGKVVAEGTQEEQDRIKFESDAVDAGYVTATMTPVQRDEAVEMYRTNLVAREQLKDSTAQLGFQSAQLDYQRKIRRNNAELAVGNLGATQYYKLNNEFSDVATGVADGTYTKEQGLQLMREKLAPTISTLNQVGAESGEVLTNMSQPILDMAQRYEDQITGKISMEVLKAEIDKNQTVQTAMILSNPRVSRAAATSKIFGHAIAIRPEIEAVAIEAITMNTNSEGTGKTADLFPADQQDAKTVGQYFDFMKDNIKQMDKSLEPEAHKINMDQQVQSILEGVGDHSGGVKNIKEYNQTIEFLASPEMGAYVSQTGGVPAEAADDAKLVIRTQYEDVVIPMLREEYETSSLGGAVEVNGETAVNARTEDLIEPVFTGAGVSFQPKEGVRLGRGATQALRSLNAKVTPSLNRFIRMTAHLNGNRDYKKAYEDNYLGIFGVELNDQAE